MMGGRRGHLVTGRLVFELSDMSGYPSSTIQVNEGYDAASGPEPGPRGIQPHLQVRNGVFVDNWVWVIYGSWICGGAMSMLNAAVPDRFHPVRHRSRHEFVGNVKWITKAACTGAT